jgi:DNA-binding transcriptional LysR family regulator
LRPFPIFSSGIERLSNFQRGCLAEEQTFRIGASATFIRRFLLPALSATPLHQGGTNYITEVTKDEEIEQRLQDLTLDFGVAAKAELSRPLQTKPLGKWKLKLLDPKGLHLNETKSAQAFEQQQLPMVLARELNGLGVLSSAEYEHFDGPKLIHY